MASIPKPTAIQVLTLMVFWGQIQNYMMRTNLSILIVDMVTNDETEKVTNGNQSITSQTCLVGKSETDFSNKVPTDPLEETKFSWGPFLQGQVLASFSYGYVTTQVIGGRLAEKYGIRKVYGGSLLMMVSPGKNSTPYV